MEKRQMIVNLKYHSFGKTTLIILLFVSLFVTFSATKKNAYSKTWLLISGDNEWRVVSTGIPTGKVISIPQQGSIWGVVLQNSPARWMYADNFNTGPMVDQQQYTVRRFVRELTSSFPKSHVTKATVRITADNGYVLWVCGTKIGQTFVPDNAYSNKPVFTEDWHNIKTYDVTDAIKGVTNQIVIDVADYGIAAGVLMEIILHFDTEEYIYEGIPVP